MAHDHPQAEVPGYSRYSVLCMEDGRRRVECHELSLRR